MLQKDLAAARKKWIAEGKTEAEQKRREESDFLKYKDSGGCFVDFHATRHTYISGIVAGGASVKTCQELARHSDPRLTIGRYSHARLHDLAGALDALPNTQPQDPEQQSLQATGTDPAESLLPADRQQYSAPMERNVAKSGEREGVGGSEGENSEVIAFPGKTQKIKGKRERRARDSYHPVFAKFLLHKDLHLSRFGA